MGGLGGDGRFFLGFGQLFLEGEVGGKCFLFGAIIYVSCINVCL